MEDSIKMNAVKMDNGKWYLEVRLNSTPKTERSKKISRDFASEDETLKWGKSATNAFYIFTKNGGENSLESLEKFLNSVSKDVIEKANEELGLEV